jgi:hypothetical protein
LLDEVGQGLAKDFNVQYRTVVADLSQEGFLARQACGSHQRSRHRPCGIQRGHWKSGRVPQD